jgi:tetratricopeptide (TPR) repeat protein
MVTPVAYEYLLSGRRGRGRRQTEIVEAATADEAANHFEAQGFSEIVVHTDDTTAPLSRPSQSLEQHCAARLVWLRTAAMPELAAYLVARFSRAIWILLAIAVMAIILSRAIGLPWGVIDAVAILFLLSPFTFGVYAAMVRAFGPNQRLVKAFGWARWEEALRILERPGFKTNTFDFHLSKAIALAGLGCLSEALREFDHVTELPEIPQALYWMLQSLIYLTAGEREKMLHVLQRARESAPAKSAITVLYAFNLLVIRRDIRQARQLLAEARRHVISDVLSPYVHALDGMLAVEDGRPQDGVELLATGFALVTPFVRANPSLLPQSARLEAHLALAQAANGDTAMAQKHFLRARPVLIAHREDDLIQRCEQAIG